ncbi:hypothetical protein BH11BAC4_BH11BAC4_12530 [soil metagenome]
MIYFLGNASTSFLYLLALFIINQAWRSPFKVNRHYIFDHFIFGVLKIASILLFQTEITKRDYD